MVYWVLIRGPLGVGKTTIAKKLATKIQGESFSVDTVLEEMGLDKVEGEGIPLKNFLLVNKAIAERARELLVTDKPVVVEGNFYHQEQIDDLIKLLPEKMFAFTLKAPLEECIARDEGRTRKYGRDAAEAVYYMVSKIEYGQAINTSGKTPDEVVEQISSYL